MSESVDEPRYSNDGKPKKLYHIELLTIPGGQSREYLRGTLRVVTGDEEAANPPNAEYFPGEYNLTFEEKENKDGYLVKIEVGENDIRDKFILTNLPQSAFENNQDLAKVAKLYGGVGNQLEIEVNGRRRKLPIEPVGRQYSQGRCQTRQGLWAMNFSQGI